MAHLKITDDAQKHLEEHHELEALVDLAEGPEGPPGEGIGDHRAEGIRDHDDVSGNAPTDGQLFRFSESLGMWVPATVTAGDVGADPAGSADAVQTNLAAHEADTDNPHGVTAAQAGADPAGAAGAVQSNLDDHVGLPDAHKGQKNSIVLDAGALQLSGDASAPGNDRYYGTDGAGAKGFHPLPEGGGGAVEVLAWSTDIVDVVNTAAEDDLANITIPGGSLQAGDLLRLTIVGRYLNNSGGLRALTLRLRLGDSTALDSTNGIAYNSLSAEVQWTAEFTIHVVSGTAQRVNGKWLASVASSRNFDALAAGQSAIGQADTSESTSANKALRMTVQHPVAHASLSCARQAFLLEKIRP